MLGTRETFSLEHNECLAWNTRHVFIGAQGMFCLEHTKCLAWNTGNVLLGTQGMSCLERKECLAWNIGSVLRGTQGMFCLEHRACPAWHTKKRCRNLSGAQFHAKDQSRHGQVYTVVKVTQCRMSVKFYVEHGKRNIVLSCLAAQA